MGSDPTSVVFDWLLTRWKSIAACAVVGALLAIGYQAASEDRFTARMNFAIPESPVGGAGFIQQVVTAFLEKEMGANAEVSIRPDGSFLMIKNDLSAKDAGPRLAAMQKAVSDLRDFLNAEAVKRYEIVRKDLRELPNNATAYSLVNHFRTYVTAQKEGIFDQIRIKDEAVTRQEFSTFILLVLGIVGGAGLGILLAALFDAISDRRQKAIS